MSALSPHVFVFRIRSISSAVKCAVRTTRSSTALWHSASTAKRRRRCMRRSSSQESKDRSAVKVFLSEETVSSLFRNCSFVSLSFLPYHFLGCKLLFKQDFIKLLGLKCVSCNHCNQLCKRGVTQQFGGMTRDFCGETCAKKFHDWYYKVWSVHQLKKKNYEHYMCTE